MRYVTAWVAALVCAGLGSSSLIASIAQGGTIEVSLTVDWGVRQVPISPTLVGVSLSADHAGNGLASQGIAAAAVASTTQLRAKMLRFPDDISQNYHWSTAASAGYLTTFEFWSLADDAEVPNLMVTVNMVNGAPDEAAKWVAMANQPAGTPNATIRSHDVPYNIGYWMLGEDITSHPEKFTTAQAYAAAALENATRMRAAFPAIKIGLWIEDGTTTEKAQYNADLLTSIALLDPFQNGTSGQRLIDFLGVAVDVPVPNRPLTDAALYPSLYAHAATRADQVVSAAEQASSTVLHHQLPIVVYRYGVDFGTEGWNHDKADSLGIANALSGMVNAFARHETLITAVYRGLNSNGFNALLQVPTAFDVAPEQRFAMNPFGEVLASYGQFLAGKSLSTDLQGVGAPPVRAFYQAPPVGRTMPGAEHVPILSVEAALDVGNGQLALFVASRALSDRVIAHVVFANTLPYLINASIVAHALQATSLSTDDYTGIAKLDAQNEVRNILIAQAANGDLTFDLPIERNAVALYTFTIALGG